MVSFSLSLPQPMHRAKLNFGESAPRRSWLWWRHPQSPGPRTPQHLRAKFYSFRSQLHLRFLQEALPNLPRTGECAVFCAPTTHYLTRRPPSSCHNAKHLCPFPPHPEREHLGAAASCSLFFLQHIAQLLTHSRNEKTFLHL